LATKNYPTTNQTDKHLTWLRPVGHGQSIAIWQREAAKHPSDTRARSACIFLCALGVTPVSSNFENREGCIWSGGSLKTKKPDFSRNEKSGSKKTLRISNIPGSAPDILLR
jgi:hypothetical protein